MVIGDPLPVGPAGGSERVAVPIYKRIWFWTIIGAVAGGAIAAGVATRPSGRVDFQSQVGFARQ